MALAVIFQSEPIPYRTPAQLFGVPPDNPAIIGHLYNGWLITPPRLYAENLSVGAGAQALWVTRQTLIDGYTVINLLLWENTIYHPGWQTVLQQFDATSGAKIATLPGPSAVGPIDIAWTKAISAAFDGSIWRNQLNGQLTQIDISTFAVLRGPFLNSSYTNLGVGFTSFLVDPANDILITSSLQYPTQISVYPLSVGGSPITRFSLPGTIVDVCAVTTTDKSTLFYVLTNRNILCLCDYAMGQTVGAFILPTVVSAGATKINIGFDPVRNLLLVFSQTADNADGSSTCVVRGFYPVPRPERLTTPIPLLPPRQYRATSFATRLLGDLGKPISGVNVTGSVSDPAAVMNRPTSPTDANGYATMQFTAYTPETLTATASADVGDIDTTFIPPPIISSTVSAPVFIPGSTTFTAATAPSPVVIHNTEGLSDFTTTHVLNIAPSTNLSPPSPPLVSPFAAFTNVGSASPQNAFDGNSATYWAGDMALGSSYLELDQGLSNRRILSSYTIAMPPTSSAGPNDWTMQGSNDGATWTVLDTRTGIGWALGQVRSFICSPTPTVAYRYFRIFVTAPSSTIVIAELGLTDLLPLVAPGEVLVVVFQSDVPTSWDSGWTQLSAEESLSGSQSVYAKIATGGETTFTLTTASAQYASWVCYRITGSLDVLSDSAAAAAIVLGTGSCQPPSLTLSGVRNALFIATYGDDGDIATAAPSGFSNLRTASWVAAGTSISTAELAVSAVNTESPGAFTNPSDNWISTTVAILAPALFEVIINTATAGAAIYYTTDGSAPTPLSSLYTGPLKLAATSTLTAYAVLAGYLDSRVTTATYLGL